MARPQPLAPTNNADAPTGATSDRVGRALDTAFRLIVEWPRWAIPLAIVALAAVLRLWAIGHDIADPYYDAAVRSMGLSWHNFFFGAVDPSAAVSIDKPPLDLWLQVLSTKLLGYNRTALALPEALGGIAAVALLYAAIARACGRLAGSLAALALAVLPIAVLTARSDTMDSVMGALLIAALWAAVNAVERRRAGLALLSAALVGLAFNVKLLQALVPVPALALLWWAVPRPVDGKVILRPAHLLGACAAMLVIVAMAWAAIASLTPLSRRPFPQGSHTGSIYRAIFVFNGIERLTGKAHELSPYGFASQAGPLRLFGTAQPHYARLVGLGLLVSLALAAFALALWRRDPKRRLWPLAPSPGRDERTVRWLTIALALWLGTGYLLFSFMGHLQPRYLEALSPVVAAVFGIASAYLAARAGARLPLRARVPALALALIVVLAAPAEASIDLIEARTSDANSTGSGGQYSAYLRAHREGARYEVASTNPLAVVGLIADDGQPVLFLRTIDGVRVSVAQLRRLVRERAVRYAIVPHPCASGRHCTPTTRWTVRNSMQVRQGLYRYFPPSRLR
jgi:4-amino-4-deoxy-L-arabinose transferase-like glycosyltransferase